MHRKFIFIKNNKSRMFFEKFFLRFILKKVFFYKDLNLIPNLALPLFSIISKETPKVSLINTRIAKILSSVFDLTGMEHYVVGGGSVYVLCTYLCPLKLLQIVSVL